MRGSLDFMDRVYIESVHWSGDLQVETQKLKGRKRVSSLCFSAPIPKKKKGGGGENEKKKVILKLKQTGAYASFLLFLQLFLLEKYGKRNPRKTSVLGVWILMLNMQALKLNISGFCHTPTIFRLT